MIQALTYCNFEGSRWLLFGPNVAPLVYYSHLPIIVASLLLAFFVFFQDRKSLSNRVLFYTILAFVIWVTCDSIYWASNRSDVIMFVWAIDVLMEPLVYIGALYLLFVLTNGKDTTFTWKVIFSILYAPLAILLSTNLTLSSFDLATCLANEGPIALYYSYFIELIVIVWTIIFSVKKYLSAKDSGQKKQILYLSIGVLFFLAAFSWGNITGSFTDDWELGQYGLFGMPIFIAFLTYSIVRFRLFNLKLIGANVLVVVLWLATASLFAIQDIETNRIVVACTLMLTTVFGFILINSVRKEVSQREKIEKLAKDLEIANTKLKELDQLKSEFVSLATHQIRAPLSAIKGYLSEVFEGDFGPITKEMETPLRIVFQSTENLVQIVGDFLNISRIEQGKMKYELKAIDLKQVVDETLAATKPNIDRSGLELKVEIPAGDYGVYADPGKVKEVVSNLIDNSIKYTPKGSIKVSLSKNEQTQKVLFAITDTGIGIPAEVLPKLFQKFTRAKDANEVNIIGTGLGLYVAKLMIEGQGGRVWAESAGKDKGSTFYMELPVAHVS